MSNSNSPSVHVLVIGAGPAGFYSISELSKLLVERGYNPQFDLVNRDIRPGGLLVYGVAPDHIKIRSVYRQFEKTLEQGNVNYFGNVTFGQDFSLSEVGSSYDFIIFATGAQADRALGIEGENISGSYSAREFVAWYNAEPRYSQLNPSLSSDTAVVVGAGNVAADVARVLLKDPSELAKTDISPTALAHLEQSCINKVIICARRSAAHLKFSPSELRDLIALPDTKIIVAPEDVELSEEMLNSAANDKDAVKNYELLKTIAQNPATESASKEIIFKFLTSPIEIIGGDNGVRQVRFTENSLANGRLSAVGGSEHSVNCGLFIRAAGYKVTALPELGYDNNKQVIENTDGRLNSATLAKCYVVGWAADGPTGVIGTNKTRAKRVVQKIQEDLEDGWSPATSENSSTDLLKALLAQKSVRYIDYPTWQQIEQREKELGAQQQRPCLRFTTNEDMLKLVG